MDSNEVFLGEERADDGKNNIVIDALNICFYRYHSEHESEISELNFENLHVSGWKRATHVNRNESQTIYLFMNVLQINLSLARNDVDE